jgi:glycine/D-amino acid oxidase-like deaminating enzyme
LSTTLQTNIRFRGDSWLKRSTARFSTQSDARETPLSSTSEVVGGFGRMGSFWLCHQEDENEISYAAAVPRGLAPGWLSSPGCPIFIATPSTAWPRIWEQTMENRKDDLIFVGNGIPPDGFATSTIIVPHFSILQICRRNDMENPIGTDRMSPKTFLHGKHAVYAAKVLEKYGVATEIVDSFSTIKVKAALKLVWASCMWLLCHSADDSRPLTFEQVHKKHQTTLDRLVGDILPALEKFVGQSIQQKDVDDYMRNYSLSIAHAIPNKELAIAELSDRNGLWLGLRTEENPQEFHQELIETVVTRKALEQLLAESNGQQPPPNIEGAKTLELDEIGLKVSGASSSRPITPLKNVIIVGGGMVGSSVAFFLAQRRPDISIQVLDLLSERDLGRTTAASWAWLNGNGKEPKAYQILNQLGLHVWNHCGIISQLPSWMGSLVRFESPPKFVNEGGYPSEGPLLISRIMELEPFASWQLSKDDEDDSMNEGATYFFPNEGCVDPSQAVAVFRREAEKLGVTFVASQNVTNILRNETTGLVCGVECNNHDSGTTITPADLVIVAAGIGSSAKNLGGIPLQHKPGQISYAKPTAETPYTHRLSRILVDPMRSSHVLQRPDGCIVAGGGALEIGGASGTLVFSNTEGSQTLLEAAKELSPSIVSQAEFTHSSEAIRPMPKDGLPAIGYLQQGQYSIVTHSGMTLGPLLSALAAGEITENMSCDLLSPFRPSRFFFEDQ